MNMDSGNSESRAPAPDTLTDAPSSAEASRPGSSLRSLNDVWSRTPAGVRIAAPWVLLVLGLAFAGWAVVHYLILQYRAEHALSATSDPNADGIMAPAAPGMVSIRVSVRVRVAGSLAPIGTSLPRMISLRMTGKDGQPYEARFDRAGVWGMEAPPGEYLISGKQKDMGEWSWEMTGDCVKPAADLKNRYIVTLDLARPFSTFDLTLK